MKYCKIDSYKSHDYLRLLNIHFPNFKADPDSFSLFRLCNLRTIGKFGYINCVKKWYFDAIYENC